MALGLQTYAVPYCCIMFVLLPQIVSFSLIRLPAAPCEHGASFDFYYLALEWAGWYCNGIDKCCFPLARRTALDFHIHGLWPTKDGSLNCPRYCDSSHRFDFSKVAQLEPELLREWSSPFNTGNASCQFWAGQWEKHGTCAPRAFPSELQYFKTALFLRRQIAHHLLDALLNAGIEPNGREYPKDDVSKALRKTMNVVPQIRCMDADQGRKQLWMVFFCIPKDNTSAFVDCPKPWSDCGDSEIKTIAFPRFSEWSISPKENNNSCH